LLRISLPMAPAPRNAVAVSLLVLLTLARRAEAVDKRHPGHRRPAAGHRAPTADRELRPLALPGVCTATLNAAHAFVIATGGAGFDSGAPARRLPFAGRARRAARFA